MSQTSSFSLPIGPVHIALEEPVYFHLDVDGETVRKVMTTFQMDADLKAELKRYCADNGMKMGETINQAIARMLHE